MLRKRVQGRVYALVKMCIVLCGAFLVAACNANATNKLPTGIITPSTGDASTSSDDTFTPPGDSSTSSGNPAGDSGDSGASSSGGGDNSTSDTVHTHAFDERTGVCACGEVAQWHQHALQNKEEAASSCIGAWVEQCCLYCSHTQTVYIEGLGHDFSILLQTVENTCTKDGYTQYQCTRCKETEEKDVRPMKGHDYGAWETVQEATCLLGGLREAVCKNDGCGQTLTESLLPFGHTTKNGKEATCELAAVCGRCNEHYGTALGHKYGEWTVLQEATCEESGEQMRICQNDRTHIQTQTLTELGHNYVDGVCSRCEAIQASEGLFYTKLEELNAYMVSSFGDCLDEYIRIPERYDGLMVTAIAADAFAGSVVKKISLSANITNIHETAFVGAAALQACVIDEENAVYTTIDGNVYTADKKTLVVYCGGNTQSTFTVPLEVERIGAFACCNNPYLQSVVVGDNVKTLETGAFKDCSALTDIQLGAGLQRIYEDVFIGCGYALNQANWSQGALYIGAYLVDARYYFSTHPKWGTRLLADGVFAPCAAAEVYLTAETLEYVGERAFCGSETMTKLYIGESVKVIYAKAFWGCIRLTQADLAHKSWRISDNNGRHVIDITLTKSNLATAAEYLRESYAEYIWTAI